MLVRVLTLLWLALTLSGCLGSGSFVSKSRMGNLELNVSAPKGTDVSQVRLFVDDQFIGNASSTLPVLHVKSGEREVRAELEGFPTYTESLLILGDPNHQILNIAFRPEPQESTVSFVCGTCGERHDEVPFAYGAPAPEYYYEIPEAEREKRCQLSSDQCVIDHEHYFVLGNVELAIEDSNEVFSWTIWVSLTQKNFERMSELWTTKGRESEPSYFGWVSTTLPGYPETLNLKARVHTRPVGQRPMIELEPTSHPLAVEQREGITRRRLHEIAEHVLHGDS